MDRGKGAWRQRSKYLLGSLAGLCLACGTASANVLFWDDFNDGDIDGWGTAAATRTISVDQGVVEIPPGGSTFYTVRPQAEDGSQVFFSTDGAKTISVSADIQAQDSDDSSNKNGEFGLYLNFTTTTSNSNRYDFRMHSGTTGDNDVIRIRQVLAGSGVTTLASITEADAGIVNGTLNSAMNHFELRLTVGTEKNVIELLMNNNIVLTAETTPVIPETVSMAIHGNNDNDIRFDNTMISTPEPAAMSLVGLAGLGLLHRRKCTKKA